MGWESCRIFPCFPFLTSYVISDVGFFLAQRLIEEENMLAPSLKQFSLRVEILPSYIPVRVAEKILFVGESVQMFENQNVNLTRKGRNVLAWGNPILKGIFDIMLAPKSAWAEWVARDLHVPSSPRKRAPCLCGFPVSC